MIPMVNKQGHSGFHHAIISFNTTDLKKVLTNSVDPDETAHMSRLIWTFTVCLLILLFSQSQCLLFQDFSCISF